MASNISGILVAGGGANWPFVKHWAEKLVGRKRVYIADRPEESIVRGLHFVHINNPKIVLDDQTQLPDKRETRLPINEGANQIVPIAEPSSPPMQVSKATSPWKVFLVEFLGGLVGFLGLGWFFYIEKFWVGCLSLLGWWVLIAILVIGIVASIFNPLFLLIIVPVWIFVPLLSAIIAMRKYKYLI